jgi:hypothetical protein
MALCSLIEIYWRFGETHCLHLQGRRGMAITCQCHSSYSSPSQPQISQKLIQLLSVSNVWLQVNCKVSLAQLCGSFVLSNSKMCTNWKILAPSQTCEKRLLASSCLSVRPSAWNISALTKRIFVILCILYFVFCILKSDDRIIIWLKSDKEMRHFKWRPKCVYDDTSWFLPGRRNVSDTSCSKDHNIHLVTNILLRRWYHLRDNYEKYGTARQVIVDPTS